MKNKQHTLPSFFLISSAVDGNETAIEKLLLFYEAYISKCCLRPFYDEYGNVYIVVDMELKGRIREVIIRTTQKHNNTPCRESKWFPAFFMPTSENGTEMTCFCD